MEMLGKLGDGSQRYTSQIISLYNVCFIIHFHIQSSNDTLVHVKAKNTMFQPVVPELLNYRIWLDSEQHSKKACQVGITGIHGSARGSRVTGWQFVFLLRDHQSKSSGRAQTSLLFGDVIQGVDTVKSLCCRPHVCWGTEGLRFTLEAFNN